MRFEVVHIRYLRLNSFIITRQNIANRRAHNQSKTRVVKLQWEREEAEKKRDDKDLAENITNRNSIFISFLTVTLQCLVKERRILSLIWSEVNVNEEWPVKSPFDTKIYHYNFCWLILTFHKSCSQSPFFLAKHTRLPLKRLQLNWISPKIGVNQIPSKLMLILTIVIIVIMMKSFFCTRKNYNPDIAPIIESESRLILVLLLIGWKNDPILFNEMCSVVHAKTVISKT